VTTLAIANSIKYALLHIAFPSRQNGQRWAKCDNHSQMERCIARCANIYSQMTMNFALHAFRSQKCWYCWLQLDLYSVRHNFFLNYFECGLVCVLTPARAPASYP